MLAWRGQAIGASVSSISGNRISEGLRARLVGNTWNKSERWQLAIYVMLSVE
jgi:hypothetical protein